LSGLNVTIPYKEKVFDYLDDLDPTAREIGAVNCIKIFRPGQGYALKGYNTDAFGFENALKPMLGPHHKKALILGTGGAAKAVHFILDKLGLESLYVSRTAREGIIGYQDVDGHLLEAYTVIINTSPLGMHPKTDSAPDIPYALLTPRHVLYDLVYNPETTRFMQLGKEQGAQVQNGLSMLHGQAEQAWKIWNSNIKY
jgi:shikimate dehydrogenase